METFAVDDTSFILREHADAHYNNLDSLRKV